MEEDEEKWWSDQHEGLPSHLGQPVQLLSLVLDESLWKFRLRTLWTWSSVHIFKRRLPLLLPDNSNSSSLSVKREILRKGSAVREMRWPARVKWVYSLCYQAFHCEKCPTLEVKNGSRDNRMNDVCHQRENRGKKKALLPSLDLLNHGSNDSTL